MRFFSYWVSTFVLIWNWDVYIAFYLNNCFQERFCSSIRLFQDVSDTVLPFCDRFFDLVYVGIGSGEVLSEAL